MAKDNSESFVNRDTPIPVVSITGPDEQSRPRTEAASGVRTPNDDNGPRHHLSASKLKDKLESLGDNFGRPETPSRVSDRLFTM